MEATQKDYNDLSAAVNLLLNGFFRHYEQADPDRVFATVRQVVEDWDDLVQIPIKDIPPEALKIIHSMVSARVTATGGSDFANHRLLALLRTIKHELEFFYEEKVA